MFLYFLRDYLQIRISARSCFLFARFVEELDKSEYYAESRYRIILVLIVHSEQVSWLLVECVLVSKSKIGVNMAGEFQDLEDVGV
jgi:hypothetical protein